jgi:hypothetical protein
MRPSRRTLWLALALVAVGLGNATRQAAQQAAPAFDHGHAKWTEVLRACVRDGGFDYAKLKQDRTTFDAYLAGLRAVTPEQLASWSEPQRFAFWLDTYNAYGVQKVIDNYPLKSIRRLDGAFGVDTVFDKGFIPLGAHDPDKKGQELSLNDIELKILRKRFRDARLHAALHSTARGGPPLLDEAYTAEHLDAQLDRQMRAFLEDPRRNRIDPEKKELLVSEVFKWFAEDFERDAKSVPEYLARFVPAAKAEFVRATPIRYLDYDWALDDVPKK